MISRGSRASLSRAPCTPSSAALRHLLHSLQLAVLTPLALLRCAYFTHSTHSTTTLTHTHHTGTPSPASRCLQSSSRAAPRRGRLRTKPGVSSSWRLQASCASRARGAALCGNQPPRALGQFALQHAPPAPDQAQGGLQLRPASASLGQLAGRLYTGLDFSTGLVRRKAPSTHA